MAELGYEGGVELTETEEGTISVRLDTGKKPDPSILRELFFAFSRAELPLLKLTMEKVSLEDIFLELTDGEIAGLESHC